MGVTVNEQRDGCSLCRYAPLSPAQLSDMAIGLGADEVRHEYQLDYLADVFAALYPDRTYQAIRIDRSASQLGAALVSDPDWVISALRKAPRRERRPQDCIVFESY